MTWFDKLLGRKDPIPQGEVHIFSNPVRMDNAIKAPSILPPEAVIFKPTKWVVYNNQIGIVYSIPSVNECVVHFVDHEGITVGEQLVPIGQCRLAKWLEIPILRRPSQVDGARLGYI